MMPVRPKRIAAWIASQRVAPERVRRLALRGGHRLEDLAGDRGREGDDHDGEDERGGAHADAERRPA